MVALRHSYSFGVFFQFSMPEIMCGSTRMVFSSYESDACVAWGCRDVGRCKACWNSEVCPDKRHLSLVQSYLYSLTEMFSALCFPSARPRHCLRAHHLAKAKTTREHTQNYAAQMLGSQCSSTLPGPILFSNRDAAQMIKGALPHPQELRVVIKVKIPFIECKLSFLCNFITVMAHLQGRRVCEGGHVLWDEGKERGHPARTHSWLCPCPALWLPDTASATISPPVNAGDDPF